MPAAKLFYCLVGVCLFSQAQALVIPAEKLNAQMVQAIVARFPSVQSAAVTAQTTIKLYQEQALLVATENYTLQYRLEQGLAAKMHAQVTIREGGVVRRTVRLPFTVGVLAPVLHAQRDIPVGTMAGAELFYTKETNIIEHLHSVVPTLSALQGQKANAHIRQDQLIQRWMFVRPPLVKLGETITVLARTEDIELRIAAEVLQAGFVGDKIRVRLRPTKKVVLVLIKAPGEYEVQW